MSYHVKVTRVERCTMWEVYDRKSAGRGEYVDGELIAWGPRRRKLLGDAAP